MIDMFNHPRRYRRLPVGEPHSSRRHYTHRAYISVWMTQNIHPHPQFQVNNSPPPPPPPPPSLSPSRP